MSRLESWGSEGSEKGGGCGGSWFLDRVEKLLLSRGEASEVRRYAKPTFAKPCPDKLRKQIASECDAVILALAD